MVHDKSFRLAVNEYKKKTDSPPASMFCVSYKHVWSFSIPFENPVAICWQVQEEARGELTTARAWKFRNINKLAVFGEQAFQ